MRYISRPCRVIHSFVLPTLLLAITRLVKKNRFLAIQLMHQNYLIFCIDQNCIRWLGQFSRNDWIKKKIPMRRSSREITWYEIPNVHRIITGKISSPSNLLVFSHKLETADKTLSNIIKTLYFHKDILQDMHINKISNCMLHNAWSYLITGFYTLFCWYIIFSPFKTPTIFYSVVLSQATRLPPFTSTWWCSQNYFLVSSAKRS